LPEIDIEESIRAVKEFKESYVSLVSRGGLVKPSDIVNISVGIAGSSSSLILMLTAFEKVLMAAYKPRAVFIYLPLSKDC